jgi:predicted  nucleic acid-binding Zn-ribbon protein
VADDLFQVLMRYHREVVAPELQDRFDEQTRTLRNQALTDLDGIYKNFDTLRVEVTMLRGAVRETEQRLAALEKRITAIDDRLDAIDKKLDHFALRDELNELRERADTIQQRIAQIESLLNEH